MRTSKEKGNSNMVMLNLSSSIEEKKLRTHGRNISKDTTVVSHESSNFML